MTHPDPSAKLSEYAESIFDFDVGSAEPAPPIGRDAELAAIAGAMGEHRVVTITGPAGIGKTALAQALVRDICEHSGGNAKLVSLGVLSHPDHLPTAVALALEVKLGSQSPVDAIVRAQGDRPLLLALDHCDTIPAAAAALIEDLSDAAPRLQWLLTAREPLQLPGEHAVALGALAGPAKPTPEAAREAGATALFEARAKAADPRFMLNRENAADVAQICRLVDGNPLAIELIVARLQPNGLPELRRRIERAMAPRGTVRPAPLRATLEWTHELLSDAQKAVFRRAAVFAGSFSASAARKVARGEGVDSEHVRELITRLVDDGLLLMKPEARQRRRFLMLDAVHEFAGEKLAAAGEVDSVRTRHLEFCTTLAVKAKADMRGSRQGEWLSLIDNDHENLLAAHAWADHAAASHVNGLIMVVGVGRWWIDRALFALGYRLTREALARRGVQRHDRLRAEGLIQAGRLGAHLGLGDEVHKVLREAIAIGYELKDEELLSTALATLGSLHLQERDPAGARPLLEEALRLAQRTGANITFAATSLGELERLQGHWAESRAPYELALARARERGDKNAQTANLLNLAMADLAVGDVGSGKQRLAEAVVMLDRLDADFPYLIAVLLCAALLVSLGDATDAARLDSAARLHLERLGWPLDPADHSFAELFAARTREALGADYAAAQADGRTLSFDEAVRELREHLQVDPDVNPR